MSLRHTRPRRRTDQRAAAAGALVLALVHPAFAQTDAGSLLRQTEPRANELPGRSEPLNAAPAATPAATPAGARFELKSIETDGNTLLSDAQLQALLAGYLGRRVGLADLQDAAATVQKAYAAKGWLVYCYLPAQDVSSGKVRLRVVEARFGGVRIEGQGSRINPAQAQAIVEAALPAGAMLHQPSLDRGLMLVDDLPGVSMSASLEPGAREGETALALRLADTPRFGGEIGSDNAGGRATGAGRFYASLRLDSPFGRGDQTTLTLLHSEGNDYLRLGQSLPVGATGWRIGANLSTLSYRLTADEFDALDGRGRSHTAGLQATYPLVRSRDRNLYLQLSADRKFFSNRAGGDQVSRYRSNVAAASLSGNLFDDWHGGGSNGGGLALSLGDLDLDGSPNAAMDAATTRADGRFAKLNYSLSRLQALNARFSLYGALAGQWADRNLDSSERFYLGGPQGVRAYPANEGGGSAGTLLNLELRAVLAPQWRLTGFYDWGQVRVNVDQGFAGAPRPNRYELEGAGAALSWSGPRGSEVRFTLARRFGSNPNPTSTGRDQDGSLKRNRVWLQATLPF